MIRTSAAARLLETCASAIPWNWRILVNGASKAFDAQQASRGPAGSCQVEIEVAYCERPSRIPNTYQAVRNSIVN
jgi:hypothetical protein